MKQLSTKTLEALLKATVGVTKGRQPMVAMKHLERVLQRHDRKGELRAGILGLSAVQFRELQKIYGFDELIKKYGFKERQDFCLALFGKLRSELLYRGWSRQRIDGSIQGEVALAT